MNRLGLRRPPSRRRKLNAVGDPACCSSAGTEIMMPPAPEPYEELDLGQLLSDRAASTPRWYQELGRAFGDGFAEVERAWEDNGLLRVSEDGHASLAPPSPNSSERRRRIVEALQPGSGGQA